MHCVNLLSITYACSLQLLAPHAKGIPVHVQRMLSEPVLRLDLDIDDIHMALHMTQKFGSAMDYEFEILTEQTVDPVNKLPAVTIFYHDAKTKQAIFRSDVTVQAINQAFAVKAGITPAEEAQADEEDACPLDKALALHHQRCKLPSEMMAKVSALLIEIIGDAPVVFAADTTQPAPEGNLH